VCASGVLLLQRIQYTSKSHTEKKTLESQKNISEKIFFATIRDAFHLDGILFDKNNEMDADVTAQTSRKPTEKLFHFS
jgi:hypothetical protein